MQTVDSSVQNSKIHIVSNVLIIVANVLKSAVKWQGNIKKQVT